jgi:hypothetical protein
MLEKQLVEFELGNGGKFLVEIEESEDTSLATERVALPSSSLSNKFLLQSKYNYGNSDIFIQEYCAIYYLAVFD